MSDRATGGELRGLDLAKLRAYLDETAPGFADGPLVAEVIAGGKSNLTYHLRSGGSSQAGDGRSWVLRRPPLGHVLATAHDMTREYRVMSALGPTGVPVPETYLSCANPDVIGAPFYLMSYVEGTVYRDGSQTAHLGPERALSIAHTLIDVLADLHDVDPESIGLGGFGRPEGFLARQLSRWHKQLDASRTRELPGIDELFDALTADVPVSGAPAIVHGDYRLDNVLVDADDRVAAVLDWEMATLGDPLTDLGLFLVYWESLNRLPTSGLTSAVNPENGFPSGAELMERYARRRSIDLSGLPWYFAFGCFKLAVIAEGIYVRHRAGQTVGAGFDHMGDIVAPLIAQGLSSFSKDA